MKPLLKLGFYSALLFGLALVGYLIYVDRTITQTFEGRRWSVPAQVFAQPLELYAGARLSRAELTIELERLGYKRHANLPHPGTFKSPGNELQIYLRSFDFMERHRDAQRISVAFAGKRITRINGESGDIPLLRLDPATIGSFFPSHGEDRIVLSPEQVPPLLSEGLKAVE
ncbi:MAG: penicillin-binding protein 1B, partial [Pseudomonadales bacterium]|nr:penicillin-binding protein 1B [Pseudomonadales bacterium]